MSVYSDDPCNIKPEEVDEKPYYDADEAVTGPTVSTNPASNPIEEPKTPAKEAVTAPTEETKPTPATDKVKAPKRLVLELEKLEGVSSLDDLIDSLNDLSASWEDIYTPLRDNKDATLESAGLKAVPSADTKIVLLGMLLSLVSEKAIVTADDLKKCIKLIEEEPYIKLEVPKKVDYYQTVGENLQEWITSQVEVVSKSVEICEQLAEIPDKIEEVVTNLPTELEELDFMEKAKKIKEAAGHASKVKKQVNQIKGEIDHVKEQVTMLKTLSQDLAAEIEEGTCLENGQKCKDAGITGIKQCYEHIFGKIVAKKQSKNDNASC